MTMKIDEPEFQTAITSALDRYVTTKSQGCLTVSSRRQAYHNLDRSACYDVLKRLTNSKLLLLELKVTHDGRTLPSFNSQQHKVNAALFNVDVPIHYGYNLVDDYLQLNNPEYTLSHSNQSPPQQLFQDGNRDLKKGHKSIKELVDELLGPGAKSSAIEPLFAGGVLTREREINTSVLMLAFNTKESDLELFDREQLVGLRVGMSKFLKLPPDQDFRLMSVEEIERHLRSAKEQVKAEIRNFLQRRII